VRRDSRTLADGPARERVLLVGQSFFDSVIDSYRRALSPYYRVRVYDPYSLVPGSNRLLGPGRTMRLNTAFHRLSRLIAREPLVLAEPGLRRTAAAFAPDIVLVDCIESLRPAAVSTLRAGNANARVIGVFSDSVAKFDRGYFFSADYDRLFFKDHFIVDTLRAKLGWKHVFYLPQACDRQLHRRVALTEKDREKYACDLTMAGSAYLYRMELLRPVIGRDVKVWGVAPNAWLDHPARRLFTGRYVAGAEKCRALLSSRIVLNANHYTEIAGTNKRTFETAAIGAFQLTDAPALREVFDPDEEVGWFGSRKEMLDKIDYYLARPTVRESMAERARLRAHSEHTYEHRWVAHLEALGLRPPPEFPVQPEALKVRAT
jgi:spore maturation protein CgeB